MKKPIFMVIILLYCTQLFSQNLRDTIEIKKTYGRTLFMQKGMRLKPNELSYIMKSNPEAYKEMEKSRGYNTAGFIVVFAGGFMVGWQAGTILRGYEPNWIIGGAGALFIISSIPYSIASTKHAIEAVRIYNHCIKKNAISKVDFRFGLTGNGFGMRVRF